MTKQEKLLEFFRGEFQREKETGFALLSKIPSSRLEQRLSHYLSLEDEEKKAFEDCSAHWSYSYYSHLVGAPEIDLRQHHYYNNWSSSYLLHFNTIKSIPVIRTMVQDYKIALHRGKTPELPEEFIRIASEIKPVKAPELRKMIRNELKCLGYFKTEKPDFFHCQLDDKEYIVSLDFGSRSAQLKYSILRPEYKWPHASPHIKGFIDFKFEWAHGFDIDGWDYIIEENVNDVLSTLVEIIITQAIKLINYAA